MERLSEREVQVLMVNTVKRHISNIFGRLKVSNRAQAIARAQQLHLL